MKRIKRLAVCASTISCVTAALLLAPPASAQVPTVPPTWQVTVGGPYGGLATCPVTVGVGETLSGDSCSAVGNEAMSRYEESRAGCTPVS
jgi:hypothetical protein